MAYRGKELQPDGIEVIRQFAMMNMEMEEIAMALKELTLYKNIEIYRSCVKKVALFSPKRSKLVAHNSLFIDFIFL
jgi:hypothetical protein